MGSRDAIRDHMAPILTCEYCGHSVALTGPLVESEMEIRTAGGFQCRNLEACDARGGDSEDLHDDE